MKKLLLSILTVVALSVQAQEINWMTMNEALAAQKEKPKKIIVDVYADWCGPCKMMDKYTFTNKEVIDYINKFFYAVKFDAEGNEVVNIEAKTFRNSGYKEGSANRRKSTHDFVMALQVQGYPSMVYFNEKGELIQAVAGYYTPQQLEIFLKMIGSDDYKAITTAKAWQDYQKSFQGSF